MAVIETWLRTDLKEVVQVTQITGNLFSGDNGGNLIGVEIFDNGEPATLTGSVTGYIIRADNVTVAVEGTRSGNKVSITLPQSAYAVVGNISIVIKLGSTTVGAVCSYVYRSTTDSIIDPGTIIPSVETLIEEIENAVASIPADYSDLWESLESNFSSSKNYTPGMYVTYDGGLYRFKVNHSGSWNANDVEEISVGHALTEVRQFCYEGVPTKNIIDQTKFADKTTNGITLVNRSSGLFHISGTKGSSGATPEFVLFRDYTAIPGNMKKGTTYNVYVKAGVANVWFTAYFNNTYTGSKTLFRSNRPLNGEQFGTFIIPTDCTGMGITIRFDDANTFDEDIEIYVIEKATNEKRYAITGAMFINNDETIESIVNLVSDLNIVTSPVNQIRGYKISDNTYHIEGTKGSGTWSTLDLYRSHIVMPEGFTPGKSYAVFLDSKDVSLWVVKYNGDEDQTGVALYKSENNKNGEQYGTFTIPENDVQGLSIGLKCDYASSFNEDVTVYISECKSEVKQDFISDIYGFSQLRQGKKMFSIGNSFLTGIIYTNGSESGRCIFDDSIYGQIALGLGISEENTTHVYHGNTGFISPSTTSPYIYDSHSDVIMETDLSGYDYCLTHFNGSDLRKTLGNVNADGTGTTLADAVVNVVNYIKTNKWICKLIILGTPPYSADYAGNNIFVTPQGTSGNSINDMDNLMYALALKYHFIYVSWQDLEISYHYMDFCDYQPGDTGARHGNSPKTYRAMGEFASTQIPAVSSAVAVGKLIDLQ